MSVLRMAAADKRAASLVGSDTPNDEPNWCLRWCVRNVYNFWGACRFGGNGKAWAINYWYAAKQWGRVVQTSDPMAIPAGAMTFSKGSSVYGHVFIADGKGGCYTTDYPVSTDIGHVPISTLMRAWGHTLLGYIEVSGEQLDFRNTSTSSTALPTVFDASHWSQAWYPWFPAEWEPRVPGIGAELRGNEPGTEASVHTFTELYSEETANDILAELRKNGDDFRRAMPAGRRGIELMYDAAKWELVSATNYASGIQNRYAYVVYLRRKSTGKVVAFIVGHGPIRSDYDKERWGRWFAGIVSAAKGPRFIACDFNRNPNGKSPRKEIEALGFRTLRSQADVVNESSPEFPSGGDDGWTLADHYTIPSEARIVAGIQDITSAKLDDHRRFESRVVIP